MGEVCGNKEVIELLEAYLETARQHPFGHIAIAMVGHPGVAACDYAGDVSLEKSSQEALGLLGKKLDSAIDRWMPPPRNESLDASYVRYNVANGPLGFDFVAWLVDAEMTRIRAGAPPPLKVGFWLGKDGRISARSKAWLENVFRPCLDLIGVVEDKAAVFGRGKDVFVPCEIVAASRVGERVPKLRLVNTPGPKGHVTITLREADYGCQRNSNIEAWKDFASYLQTDGERVIFVRDTAKAHEPLPGFEICPAASIDLHARLALYSGAKMNFFVVNGPCYLAVFSDAPWMIFVNEGEDYIIPAAKWPPKFRDDAFGIGQGGQFPWSREDQRIVWQTDTYGNIMRAWDSLVKERDSGKTNRSDHDNHPDRDGGHHEPRGRDVSVPVAGG